MITRVEKMKMGDAAPVWAVVLIAFGQAMHVPLEICDTREEALQAQRNLAEK